MDSEEAAAAGAAASVLVSSLAGSSLAGAGAEPPAISATVKFSKAAISDSSSTKTAMGYI